MESLQHGAQTLLWFILKCLLGANQPTWASTPLNSLQAMWQSVTGIVNSEIRESSGTRQHRSVIESVQSAAESAQLCWSVKYSNSAVHRKEPLGTRRHWKEKQLLKRRFENPPFSPSWTQSASPRYSAKPCFAKHTQIRRKSYPQLKHAKKGQEPNGGVRKKTVVFFLIHCEFFLMKMGSFLLE